MTKLYNGINIQFPISELILTGEKVVETRTYPIPEKYVGEELLLIETPGRKGNFKSRIRGKIRFGDSFKYANKSEFYKDFERHQVATDSTWAWDESKPKFGWPIEEVWVFKYPKPLNKRTGVIFSTGISI